MLEKIMRRYAMSREGAKGFLGAVCACTVSDLVLMFPVGLLYFLSLRLHGIGFSADVPGWTVVFSDPGFAR